MEKDGWVQVKDGRWQKTAYQATEMVVPEVKGLGRRITRDVVTGALLEDLWVSSRTPRRLLHRSLRRPRDIEIQVELHNIDEHTEAVSWDDQPMEAMEACAGYNLPVII